MSEKIASSTETAIQNARELLLSAEGFDSALPKLLELLGKDLNCRWAAYWKVDSKVGVLKLASLWNSESLNSEPLLEDSRKRRFSSGEGMVGKVWRLRKPIWSTDLVRDMSLPRSIKANSAGLVAGIWFSIITDQTTFGVIELLTDGALPPDDELDRILDSFGKEIGEYIEHT